MMIRVIIKLLLSFLFLAYNFCCAHDMGVEGLFYSLGKSSGVIYEKPPVSLERNNKGHCSTVVSINGVRAFNRNVILASFKKPVILKICSEKSQESAKVKKSFQQAAAAFLGKAYFIACDVFDQINDFSENYDVIMQVMARENIKQLNVPLFLFYKDGVLYRPEHMPAAMLHGFYTKENLQAFIQRKFFSRERFKDSQDFAEMGSHNDLNQQSHDSSQGSLSTQPASLLDVTPTLTGAGR